MAANPLSAAAECRPPGPSVWWAPAFEEPDEGALFSSAMVVVVVVVVVVVENHRVLGRRFGRGATQLGVIGWMV